MSANASHCSSCLCKYIYDELGLFSQLIRFLGSLVLPYFSILLSTYPQVSGLWVRLSLSALISFGLVGTSQEWKHTLLSWHWWERSVTTIIQLTHIHTLSVNKCQNSGCITRFIDCLSSCSLPLLDLCTHQHRICLLVLRIRHLRYGC